MTRLAPILVLLLLLVPAQAHAGVVEVESKALQYVSYAGETNDLTITRVSPLVLHVREASGLGVSAGDGCTRTHFDEATCTYRGTSKSVTRLYGTAYLHDGDDKARGPLTMQGGDGNDELVHAYEFFDDFFHYGQMTNGGPGDDTLTGLGEGGEGNDTLRALPGRRAGLDGGPGNDRVEGGDADDTLAGGPGTDHVVSGGGRDTLLFTDDIDAEHDPAVIFSAENGGEGGRVGEHDTYEGVFTHIRGDDAPGSSLTGNGLGNEISGFGTLRGLAGEDELTGGYSLFAENHDTLIGGPGDDLLDSGDLTGESDTLAGGEGDDRLVAWDAADEEGTDYERDLAPTRDELACGPGKDRIDIDSIDPRPADCEIVAIVGVRNSTITGSATDDVLPGFNGDGDADRIFGRDGDDLIDGLNGPDRLYGEDGDDRLTGESANPGPLNRSSGNDDRLFGGNGADHLIGGYGNDRLSGGRGADRFSGGDGNDLLSARDGTRDKVRCGRGRDRVIADRGDSVARDCEVVRRR